MISHADLVFWVSGKPKPTVPKNKLGICLVAKMGIDKLPEDLDNVVGVAFAFNNPNDSKNVNTQMMKILGKRILYAEFCRCYWLTDLTMLDNLKVLTFYDCPNIDDSCLEILLKRGVSIN